MKNDGSIESIYCHFDGYLEGVGRKLNDYYSDYESVKDLIKLGNIESLKEKIKPDLDSTKNNVTIAYHRDLGDKYNKTKPMISKNIKEFDDVLFDCWIGYIYLYDEKSNKWLWDYYSLGSDAIELKDLKISIKNLNQVAIKSGYYFMMFDKDEVPFFKS